ncbi:MAG: hypothetical protein JXA03_10510 [Bacteroidales bacterium]|nr:hypothetical protein [Bacteroidales bacterium]
MRSWSGHKYLTEYSFSAKVKSSSLVYSVFVMVIVALVCSSLILLSLTWRKTTYTHMQKDKVISNVESGIALLLADTALLPDGQSSMISLFGETDDSVLVEKERWGVFEKLRCSARYRDFFYSKTALAGNYCKTADSYALYLPDHNKPLSLCGDTRITGKCYLPEAGVKRAYIEGRNFSGSKLIDGEMLQSRDSLPVLKEVFRGLNPENLKERFMSKDSIGKVNFFTLATDSIVRSFNEPALVIYSRQDITLDFLLLKGHIAIICEGNVTVTGTCKMQDVVMCCNSVWFAPGFNGNLQVFASDTVFIEEGCHFDYPSVIGLIRTNPEGATNTPIVSLAGNCSFEGVIFGSCRSEVVTTEPVLKVGKEAAIKGQVHWEGSVELLGKIYGTAACNRFMLRTPSSVYENHLMDVVVSLDELSGFFTGVCMTEEQEPYRIVQWLN